MSNEQRLAQYYNKVSKDVMEASKKLRLLIMQGYEMAFAKTMLTSLFTQEIVDSAEGFLMLFIRQINIFKTSSIVSKLHLLKKYSHVIETY